MALAQLTSHGSLRDSEVCLRAPAGKPNCIARNSINTIAIVDSLFCNSKLNHGSSFGTDGGLADAKWRRASGDGGDNAVFGLWQIFHYVLNIVTSWQVYPVLSLAVELISM